ncbi:Neuroligin-3 [Cyphomyrmex costatus]|uniref:Neuroligin-3 n=1 Tax=Cyphomyrmex costatus TaxID=456900 RepID=A0A151IKT4_9HYME|nr:Neuroligin-3 [Cyphomyrmex costatus]
MSSSSLPRKRKRKDLSPPDTVLLTDDDWQSSVKHVLQQQRLPQLGIIVSYRTRRDILHRRQDVRSARHGVPEKLGNRQTSGISGERCCKRSERKGGECGQGRDGEENKRDERRESAKDIAGKVLLRRVPSEGGIAKSVFLLALLCAQCCLAGAEALAGTQKYCTRTIKTRYGTLRGIEARSSTAVETYYGVPYATPPLGALRYMPPVTPTPWRGIKFADTIPPACPQRPPVPDEGLPRQRQAYLKRLVPVLANQSEDCLYLNLYVPKAPHERCGRMFFNVAGSIADSLPALLLIHGDSYSWGAGNSFDGTALAAHGRLIVVSINFRLGVLGFLKTGSKGSAQGNYGLMDLVAGLHWLRENLGAFGGDPERLALLGHGTGAALANFLAVSPMAKELIGRVILLGGSALSPWAVQRDPLAVKRRVAEKIKCPGDVEADDIAPCLRLKSVEELLAVPLDPPRFTSGFAPFVDGTVLPQTVNQNFQPTASSSGLMPIVPGPGAEFADFGNRDLLFGLTSDEAWVNLTERDLQRSIIFPRARVLRVAKMGEILTGGIPTLIIAIAGIDDATSVAVYGIVKSVMFSHDALWYQILQGPIAIIGGLGFGIMWGWLAKYVPEKGDPFMVPLRVLMLLGGGLLAVFGSEAIELGGAGPLAVVAAAFVSCYFWQQEGWDVDDNPVATSFEIFWMIFEPILFGITGTQIKINELEGKTVYLGLGCLVCGIVIRIGATILFGIGSKLNLKEKVFIALALMSKATVQAALGPVTLDEVNKDDQQQVGYAEIVLMMCVLSVLLTAPAGAIMITLLGPKLLTKTTTPVSPLEAWKTRRPSIRDISIINEDPDLEETANERKP